MDTDKFYTLRGYSRRQQSLVSAAMEDYLEMIYRSVDKQGFVRLKTLASQLHVTPSASSKMVNRLKDQGLVEFEPYGIIRLTEDGELLGHTLYHRHEVLHRFFCRLNHAENQLELVEKIEHFIDSQTIHNMEQFLQRTQEE